MTVTYQVLNMANGGGSENLLINPRGKINQANESDGVLSAGQYFCDGWKAGAAGAEVYRDADGFRLISGSILQLVPNNLDVGRTIKGNMDSVLGTPAIRINGGTDSELSDDQPYITFEVFGNNSKFTRLILSESEDLPVYQQSIDELTPCLPYLEIGYVTDTYFSELGSTHYQSVVTFLAYKANIPAISFVGAPSTIGLAGGWTPNNPRLDSFRFGGQCSQGVNRTIEAKFIADARL
ncbi:hypothetical protein BCU71_25425 [Vibrio lentus]|uniref:hypothetical protein n=1 Tax=Vibrio lentus TaxID=136468 RepID=UPI000C82DF58|nr:hypothetical protein [Vibrio lentus]PMH25292.1 hypothetical protein BCU71_25425 [Vibrio lentus]